MPSLLRNFVILGVAGALLASCGSDGPADRSGATSTSGEVSTRSTRCSTPTGTLADAGGWAARIAARPDSVGLVIDDGRGGTVAHRADTAFPLASAAKIVHLLAYADAVTRGRIDPGTEVRVADWERWYTPGADAGAHAAALKRMGITSSGTVVVAQIVSAMVQESDNAAADWLRAELGDAALRTAAASTGWNDVDLPDYAGAVVRMARPDLVPAGLSRAQIAPIEQRLGRRYAADPTFAAAVMRSYADAARRQPQQFVTRALAWANTTAKATPRQLLGAYRAVVDDRRSGSAIARRALEWQGPQPALGGTLGFKGGSYPGVLTFGSYLRRDDGTTGYAIVLGRGLPSDPSQAQQVAGQQGLVLDALTSKAALRRVQCVA